MFGARPQVAEKVWHLLDGVASVAAVVRDPERGQEFARGLSSPKQRIPTILRLDPKENTGSADLELRQRRKELTPGCRDDRQVQEVDATRRAKVS